MIIFQRLMLVVMLVAIYAQSTAAALMPVMNSNMHTMQSQSEHCQSMAVDVEMPMENMCLQACDCCPGTCNSTYIISDKQLIILAMPTIESSSYSLSLLSTTQSFFRPPIIS